MIWPRLPWQIDLIFGGVYAAATLGQMLREVTHGHTLQLASVARAHLVGLVQHSDLLRGIGARALVDIDSLLRPVYGHAKQGASYGHTKIAGKQIKPLTTDRSFCGSADPVTTRSYRPAFSTPCPPSG